MTAASVSSALESWLSAFARALSALSRSDSVAPSTTELKLAPAEAT